MIQQEETPWDRQPNKPWAEIVQDAAEAIQNPIEAEIHVSVTLKGLTASRYHFLHGLIKNAFDFTDEEIAHYIIRAGLGREIERMVGAIPQPPQ